MAIKESAKGKKMKEITGIVLLIVGICVGRYWNVLHLEIKDLAEQLTYYEETSNKPIRLEFQIYKKGDSISAIIYPLDHQKLQVYCRSKFKVYENSAGLAVGEVQVSNIDCVEEIREEQR